jgi:bifunctional non-homologous end joining protein LigD
VKTTGGKGLHVVVPIVARDGWDETKDFCRRIAGSIVADAPHDFVATMAKSKRRGKVFLDYFRNSRGATAIAPYSTRARIGAPVATPLTWEELDSQSEPGTFDVGKVLERMRQRRADPWRGFFELRQRVSAAKLRRLEGH